MQYGNWEYRYIPVEQIPKIIINFISKGNTEECIITPKVCISVQQETYFYYIVITERVQPLLNFKTNICEFVLLYDPKKPNVIAPIRYYGAIEE